MRKKKKKYKQQNISLFCFTENRLIWMGSKNKTTESFVLMNFVLLGKLI